MKALTDKIIERLKELSETCYPGLEFGEGLTESARIIEQYEKEADFDEIARVMMKHLGQGEKYHPHHTVIITNSTAELVEGQKSVGQVMDYVPD